MTPRDFPRQSGYVNVSQVYVTVELPVLYSISVFPVLYFAINCVSVSANDLEIYTV